MESAGKMLLMWIYEGLCESNMAWTPCIIIIIIVIIIIIIIIINITRLHVCLIHSLLILCTLRKRVHIEIGAYEYSSKNVM